MTIRSSTRILHVSQPNKLLYFNPKTSQKHRSRNREYSSMKVGAIVVVFIFFLSLVVIESKEEEMSEVIVGNVREVEGAGGVENSVEIEELARFAVDEHNKKENALLEFVKVLKAKEQVVAGTMHHLTLEAIDGGKKKIYEAKVWLKPWMNFKELHEFKHTGDSPPSFTSSDLGVKKDGSHGEGWREVPAHDPVVQDAANHAVKTLQQKSNSLAPYELLEILLAKAEVIEDACKFDILMKLKRGTKEEKYKVEVHKTLEGTFKLNKMEASVDSSDL